MYNMDHVNNSSMMAKSSIGLPGGGDTHIHPFGNGIKDFTVTTSIPISGVGNLKIHDNPLDPMNPRTNNINMLP